MMSKFVIEIVLKDELEIHTMSDIVYQMMEYVELLIIIIIIVISLLLQIHKIYVQADTIHTLLEAMEYELGHVVSDDRV